MSDLAVLRGVKDIILENADKFNYIIDITSQVVENYNFSKAYFPIIENSQTYFKTLGEESDIVNKEMYSFIDKGENQVTLRPEFTAGIVRSLISNRLFDKLPLKFFSYGPVFRYERPQKGRQRQFYQINFEYFGNDSYFAEAEVILLVDNLLTKLGIKDKITLELNSLGSDLARKKFKTELVNYLSKYQNDLSDDSKRRLESNPLRILDSKNNVDRDILSTAPQISEFYEKEDKIFQENLLGILENNNIKYNINSKLVRGLDYYSKTVFEFTTEELGAQNAVFAGGRYDNLVKNMGGKDVSAIGFAGGMERLQEIVSNKYTKRNIDIVVVNVTEDEKEYAFSILQELRVLDINSEGIFTGNALGKKLKKAHKYDAKLVAIIGEDEKKSQNVKIKNYSDGKEIIVPKEEMQNSVIQLLCKR